MSLHHLDTHPAHSHINLFWNENYITAELDYVIRYFDVEIRLLIILGFILYSDFFFALLQLQKF